MESVKTTAPANTPQGYLSLMLAHVPATIAEAPRPTPRRQGTTDEFEAALTTCRTNLEYYRSHIADGSVSLRQLIDTATAICSLLYTCGAPAPVWRMWASIVMLGYMISNNLPSAAVWGCLCGQWGRIESFPDGPTDITPIYHNVIVSHLAGGRQRTHIPEEPTDPIEQAWSALVTSIPDKQHDITTQSLVAIAEHSMADRANWETFDAAIVPAFDADACAVAALASHYGWTADSLVTATKRFLMIGMD